MRKIKLREPKPKKTRRSSRGSSLESLVAEAHRKSKTLDHSVRTVMIEYCGRIHQAGWRGTMRELSDMIREGEVDRTPQKARA